MYSDDNDENYGDVNADGADYSVSDMRVKMVILVMKILMCMTKMTATRIVFPSVNQIGHVYQSIKPGMSISPLN